MLCCSHIWSRGLHNCKCVSHALLISGFHGRRVFGVHRRRAAWIQTYCPVMAKMGIFLLVPSFAAIKEEHSAPKADFKRTHRPHRMWELLPPGECKIRFLNELAALFAVSCSNAGCR